MASAQLQKANQTWKALAEAGAKTPQEMRPVLEGLFKNFPSAGQVKCEPVSAGGVGSSRPTPRPIARSSICTAVATSWAPSTRIAN